MLNKDCMQEQNFDYYDNEYDYLTHYIINKYDYDPIIAEHPLRLVEGRLPNSAERKCYSFGNEMLAGYMQQLGMEGKRVVTVGSSGDQVLNALFYGAKDITLIDGNPYTRAFVEYKMALIKNLSYEEFVDVFSGRKLFSYKTYRKISHDLSKPVQQFWDKLMLYQSTEFTGEDEEEIRTIKAAMLTKGIWRDGASVFYDSPSAYNELQWVLRKNDFTINYQCCDFEDFPKELEGEFDIMIFSNIYDYFIDERKFADVVRDLYYNKLNDGGKIQVHYELGLKSGERLKDLWFPELDLEKIVVEKGTGWENYAWIINKPKYMELT